MENKKLKKNELHYHDWQYPVKHDDGENYEVICGVEGCGKSIKVTKKQFEQGGYIKPKTNL